MAGRSLLELFAPPKQTGNIWCPSVSPSVRDLASTTTFLERPLLQARPGTGSSGTVVHSRGRPPTDLRLEPIAVCEE